MGVYNGSIYGTMHVAMYLLQLHVRDLCDLRRTSYMHRVVVKKNTTTEDAYYNTEEKH